MCSFAGGDDSYGTDFDKCEVYSTETCKWVQAASMNVKRTRFSLICFQGKVWAIGGISNQKRLNTIETYDLAENNYDIL